ncbi:DUF4350 domain-containing protein [Humibacter albus]|uniref:DUF4350 domain-containing protein n=1 Tax=Humibacter albus TaxID=427754 RepID=UPI0003B42D50|nr:DUF4350 domain-containing protein [Humibacter albus]
MTATAAPALSRTPAQSLRRARGWIILVAILVIGSAIATAIQLSLASSSADPMGASNPGPQGGQALARVLAQRGVDVRVVSTLDQARQKASDRRDTTVLVSDPNGYLDASQSRSLLALGAEVVAIAPPFEQLNALAPGVAVAGTPQKARSSSARCDVAAARRAGSVRGVQTGYRVSDAAVGCFYLGDAYALAQTEHRGATVSVVGATLFDNQRIDRAGNAALAIGLLGAHRTLVWYLPSEDDVKASGAPTLAQITPGWLTPAILLLIVVTIAAALWRGRRFGPLVIEDLPVPVKADETMQGRARLYRAAGARIHALDSLRLGALRRIGTLCGLPPHAPVEQVVSAAAAVTGTPMETVRDVLLDATPRADAEAREQASRLAALEAAVRAAVDRAP